MNEQDEQNPKDRPPESKDDGSPFLRGCGIVAGIAALVFFFIVGACFISFSR